MPDNLTYATGGNVKKPTLERSSRFHHGVRLIKIDLAYYRKLTHIELEYRWGLIVDNIEYAWDIAKIMFGR